LNFGPTSDNQKDNDMNEFTEESESEDLSEESGDSSEFISGFQELVYLQLMIMELDSWLRSDNYYHGFQMRILLASTVYLNLHN